jgi:hypothetical protein
MIFALYCLIFIIQQSIDTDILFHENFNDLNNWETFKFGAGKHESVFLIDSLSGQPVLRAESDASASGYIGNWRFDPYQYPFVCWRWKVERHIPNADGRTKDTDDYPLRIFVIFREDESELNLFQKIQNAALKLVYGFDPPHSSISYVWSNSQDHDSTYSSPYTDDVQIICLRNSADIMSGWRDEQVNLLDDYRRCFNKSPPSVAAVAVMCDSDNTGKSSLAFLDFIQVAR